MGGLKNNIIIFLLGLFCLSHSFAYSQSNANKILSFQQNISIASVSKLPVITYDYKLKGLDGSDLIDEFKSRSGLELLKKRPVYSSFALSKRADDDKKILQKILYSFGYYDGIVTVKISDSTKKKIDQQIEFFITLGQRYTLKRVVARFEPLGKGPAPCQKNMQELGLILGEHFTASKVLSVFDKFKDNLENCGYPFSKIKKHEAILSRSDKTVILILKINPGPFVKFGIIRVKSSGVVSKEYIKNRSPFKEGEPYDQRKVDAYHDKLGITKLFKSINIKHNTKKEDVLDGEEMPMDVGLIDGKPRTISAGIKFGTTSGIGTHGSWMHRNLTGKADKFVISAEQSQQRSHGNINYYLPDFLKINQTLGSTIEYKEERTKAYNSRGYGASSILNNELKNGWSYSYGLMFESIRLSQYSSIIHVDGIGVPLGFTINKQNDILEPSSGVKFTANLTPEYGHIGHSRFITRTQIYGSYHLPMDKHHKNVLALWTRFGSIFGGNVHDLPGDRRFFSGGGGSIRGYGHQLAGPLDGEGKPIGGKSLLEFGIEPRIKFGDTWGAVVFLEGGAISPTTYPTLINRLFLGAGVGLRYYTAFGPIRADIAIPFRKRHKDGGKVVDRAFQVYISIGQAF